MKQFPWMYFLSAAAGVLTLVALRSAWEAIRLYRKWTKTPSLFERTSGATEQPKEGKSTLDDKVAMTAARV